MTTATALSIDREVIERFIIEVDALAVFDLLLHGQEGETWLQQHIWRVLDDFENATIRPLSDEESQELHNRGRARAREVWREFVVQTIEPSDV